MSNTAHEIQENFIINPEDGTELNINFEFISPAVAVQMLENNHERNRRTNYASICKYKNQMLKGLWISASGESLKFSSGVLIDGQHRIEAVLAANKENPKFKGVYMLVVRGIPEKAMNSIDDGHKRTLNNAFQIAGKSLPNQTAISTGLRVIYTIKKCVETGLLPSGVRHKYQPSNSELLQFFDQLPNFNKKMAQYHLKFKYTSVSRIMPNGLNLAMWYLFSDIDEELTYSIFKGFESGIPLDGLGASSPVHKVYTRATLNRERGIRTEMEHNIMIFIWLFGKVLAGEKIQKMPASWPWELNRKNPVVKSMTDKLISF